MPSSKLPVLKADYETASFLDEQSRVRKYSSPESVDYLELHSDVRCWVMSVKAKTSIGSIVYALHGNGGDRESIGNHKVDGRRVLEALPWRTSGSGRLKEAYGVMELQPGQVNWGNINPQPLPGAICHVSGMCLPVAVNLPVLYGFRKLRFTGSSSITTNCWYRWGHSYRWKWSSSVYQRNKFAASINTQINGAATPKLSAT